jgi:hypothetical protein
MPSLSPAHSALAKKHLQDKCGQAVCAMCVQDVGWRLQELLMIPTSDSVKPMVSVECKGCGHTVLFASDAMGITSP